MACRGGCCDAQVGLRASRFFAETVAEFLHLADDGFRLEEDGFSGIGKTHGTVTAFNECAPKLLFESF